MKVSPEEFEYPFFHGNELKHNEVYPRENFIGNTQKTRKKQNQTEVVSTGPRCT